MADEEDYLDLVIAGELVSQWLEVIKTSARVERVAEAAEKLRKGVERSEAYIEEALEEDAQNILTEFLQRHSEEWNLVFDDVKAILACLEHHKKQHGNVVSLNYGGYEIRIREGALHDGLGARMWKVAHVLNTFLASHSEMLQNQRILELGSGCGSSGILAAKIAPSSTVVLTDCAASVLDNLKVCCRMNEMALHQDDSALEVLIDQMNDEFIEALSCEEGPDGVLDDGSLSSCQWEVANVSIRYLCWDASQPKNEQEDATETATLPPELEDGDVFDIIIGSEVLYEEDHASAIAKLLQKRLSPNGRCIIVGAVREKMVFEEFVGACEKLTLRVRRHECKKLKEHGIDEVEYEGGVVLLAIDHEDTHSWTDSAILFEDL